MRPLWQRLTLNGFCQPLAKCCSQRFISRVLAIQHRLPQRVLIRPNRPSRRKEQLTAAAVAAISPRQIGLGANERAALTGWKVADSKLRIARWAKQRPLSHRLALAAAGDAARRKQQVDRR